MSGSPLCELLCLAAHPDDAELALGGTLRQLADRGRRVWVGDLTRGGLGSNADPDERWAEATAAAGVLRLAGRLQLDLPDGFLSAARPDQVGPVAAVIRLLRPRWLLVAPAPERHPDHLEAPALTRRAAFLAGLGAYAPPAPAIRWWPAPAAVPPAGAPWRPEVVLETCPEGATPTVLFDCDRTWEAKREAISCYRSQFQREPGRAATRLNDPDFLAAVERRGRAWGRRAGTGRAEALRGDAAPVLDDLPAGTWRQGER